MEVRSTQGNGRQGLVAVLIGILAMLVIVAIAVTVIGIVMLGKRPRLAERMPELADKAAILQQHLDGEAEPPAVLVEAASDVADHAAQVMHRFGDRTPVTSR